MFLGRTALIERRRSGYAIRPQPDLERLLGRAYGGADITLDRAMPGLSGVASALGQRNLCLAQIAAVHLRFPDLPDAIARSAMEAEDLLIKGAPDSNLLARGGSDPAEHPRAEVPPNRGWFAPTDGPDGALRPTQTAAEEEERAPEEMFDPEAPVRQALWGARIAILRELDPNNPQLSYVVGPNWLPSDHDLTGINAEIGNAVTQRGTNFVMPGGNPIGRRGGNVDVRMLDGGMRAAQRASTSPGRSV